MLDNPEKAAKDFKALTAHVSAQEKLILDQGEKIVHLESRVKVLEDEKEGK